MLSFGWFPGRLKIYMPTFRNTLFHLHRQVGACRMKSAGGIHAPTCPWRWNRVFRVHSTRTYLPMKMEQSVPISFYTHLPAYENGTECSETSAYKFQTPGNHPKESIQNLSCYFVNKTSKYHLNICRRNVRKSMESILHIIFHPCYKYWLFLHAKRIIESLLWVKKLKLKKHNNGLT